MNTIIISEKILSTDLSKELQKLIVRDKYLGEILALRDWKEALILL